MNASCPWKLFDDREKDNLDTLIDVTGGLSTVLSFWFILAYFYTSLKENGSYDNIGCFFISAWIRRAASITVGHYVDKKSECWPDVPFCKAFAFFETFMAVHEVECLTHVCIERFVIAKYNTHGWAMPRKHYVMFRWLCLLFAGAYALAPALGVADYGFDFTCSSCTMDIVLQDGWRKYITATIFYLRSFKPVGVMIFMLIRCKALERAYDDSPNNQLQRQITRVWTIILFMILFGYTFFILSVSCYLRDTLYDKMFVIYYGESTYFVSDAVAMTSVSLVCWTPIALIRGWVVLMQLIYGSGVLVLPSPFYVKWALLLHWNSLTPTALTLFLLDRNIRSATMQLTLGTFLGNVSKHKVE